MYRQVDLAEVLRELPGLEVKLANIECEDFCSCGSPAEESCFSGEALSIFSKVSGMAFTAVWRKLPSPFPEGCMEIYVLPPGGFSSALHRWFTGAQRVGGRPFGIGPDFVNLEPEEWPAHSEIFENMFFGDFYPANEVFLLPDAIHKYIQELESVFASMRQVD